MKAFERRGSCLRILDQRLLPGMVQYIDCRTSAEVASAIGAMAIRGAPAIGIAAAYGVVLAAKEAGNRIDEFNKKVTNLRSSRPTAVNLMWAVDRMTGVLNICGKSLSRESIRLLEKEAERIEREDLESCRRIGIFGNELIEDGDGILTHCNAGALATAGWGTALGVVRSAWETGKRIHVFADETRPYLQGARDRKSVV
jgi:methylthioribose-1-phosphate isomerase